MNNIADPPYLF